MSDLVLGYAALAAGAVALFLLTRHGLLAAFRCRLPIMLCLVAVCGLFFYIRNVWYDPAGRVAAALESDRDRQLAAAVCGRDRSPGLAAHGHAPLRRR